MSAYVVVHIEVSDAEQFEQYKTAAAAAVEKHGGRYLARGGRLEVLEGEPPRPRLVVLEFPDLATARRWYDSPEYREAIRLREGAARFDMVAVEGV